jgi:hypothetical protein
MCGVRLSEKTSFGDVRWKPSHIDDKGIYCISCYQQINDARYQESKEK